MAAANPQDLAGRLGHDFRDASLLRAALTHPSLGGGKPGRQGGFPYERLEFLGDRVLGLVIAEWLYAAFPQADEGEMAKRHTALVNRDALRAVADRIDLASFVRLAAAETVTGPRQNLAVHADAMEAVIGALYLDGGYAAAQRFIRAHWQDAVAVEATPDDPKTMLQEWAQKRGAPLPVYKTVGQSGPAHAPHFRVEVRVQGQPPATAEGESKRAAQKAAAALLLEQVKD